MEKADAKRMEIRRVTEAEAYAFVEARLWPQGPICPKCGVIGNSAKLKGKSTRHGVYKCRDCRKPFRVTVGTTLQASHVPLDIWVRATVMRAKGAGVKQIRRVLFVSQKTAWMLVNRIREGQLVERLNLAK